MAEYLKLAENVILVPVEEVNVKTQKMFEWTPTDYVLTFLKSRKTSQLIPKEIAVFLEQFKEPSLISKALISYCIENKINIDDKLEDLLRLANKFIYEKVIVTTDSSENKKDDFSFKLDEFFGEYKIVKTIQSFEDAEVYQLRLNRKLFALKIQRVVNDKKSLLKLTNEAGILKRLDGKHNPSLVKTGYKDGKYYLITEWIKGIPILTFHNEKLNKSKDNYGNHLLALKLIEAFHHIHSSGVLHGDIHPNNILVTGNSTVKIIDFGLSVNKKKTNKSYFRNEAYQFFLEPEFVLSKKEKTRQYIYTEFAEQYALAVLLYFIYTGEEYLNFSIEKQVLYSQIADSMPVSFHERNIYGLDNIEKILRKALSKKPEARYLSLKKMFEDLIAVKFTKEKNKKTARKSNFVIDRLVDKYGLRSELITIGIQRSPTASANFGACGIAYFFHHLSKVLNDPTHLATAEIWLERAMNEMDKESAFFSNELKILSSQIDINSLYHGKTGLYYVGILIALSSTQTATAAEYLKRFTSSIRFNEKILDATLGMSSTLIGASLILKELKNFDMRTIEYVSEINAVLLNPMWQYVERKWLDNSPLFNYDGIAHGWAGLLYATLTWCDLSGTDLPSFYLTILKRYEDKIIKNKNNSYINISDSQKEAWPGWCHGVSGHIFLLNKLYKYFNKEKYLQISEGFGNYIIQSKRTTTAHLCCGAAGEAYAFLNLFKITNDKKWYNSLLEKSDLSVSLIEKSEILPHSLYKGELGVGILKVDCSFLSSASMPLFEL